MKLPQELLINLIAAAAVGTANAQDQPRLLKELDRTPGHDYGVPLELTPSNGKVFFLGENQASGAELWCTDGSPAGTALLKDIFPGKGSSSPHQFVAHPGGVFFLADDGEHGSEWWTSDGTAAGTHMVADVTPGPYASLSPVATLAGGKLFFMLPSLTEPGEYELWKSDGTEAGTHAVAAGFDRASRLIPWGDKVVFDSQVPFGSSVGLWQSDGSLPGTTWITGSLGSLNSIEVAGDSIYFVLSGGELYRSDGTPAGTQMLADLTYIGSGHPDLEGLVVLNDKVFFINGSYQTGPELWTTDGTVAGTKLAVEVTPGILHPPPYLLHAVNDLLYFVGADDRQWRSDGTPAGTYPIAELGGFAALPRIATSPTATYLGFHQKNTWKLWRTDGTAEGTKEIAKARKILAKGEGGTSMVVAGEDLYVATYGYGQPRNSELWRVPADGAPVLLARFAKGSGSAEPPMTLVNESFPQLDNRIFFPQVTGGSATDIWSSDGSTKGTRRTGVRLPNQPEKTVMGEGKVFYALRDKNRGPELHWLDGTTRGVAKPKTPGSDPTAPLLTASIGGVLFYGPNSAALPDNLWRSDGTTKGTRKVLPGETPPAPPSESALFLAYTPAEGQEVWVCDGTREGTKLLVDVWPGPFTSFAKILGKVGTATYFEASNANQSRRLWLTEGTPETTHPVKTLTWMGDGSAITDLVAFKGAAWFIGFADSSFGLWHSDGTAAGTYLVKSLGAALERFGSERPCMTIAGDTLFFSSFDDEGGYELWKSDGTTAGTVRVTDLFPGPAGSDPRSLLAVGSKVYFSADDGIHGFELCVSDGTPAGTHIVADLTHGDALSSHPGNLTFCAGQLFFNAGIPGVGRELHVLDLD